MESKFSLEDIGTVAKQFIRYTQGHKLFAFHGNLGAGKTTFIQALCREMGVNGTVSSPTFSIINEYKAGDEIIYHIDLYRVKDAEEAMHAGVEECLYSGDVCFVEWPERISMPAFTVSVFLETVTGSERRMVCKLPS